VELKLKKAQSVAMGLKFTGNSAELGGGMYVDNTTLSCEGQMSFVANTASRNGGGIFVLFSTLQCDGNCTFAYNTVNQSGGGGIYSWESTIASSGMISFISNFVGWHSH